MCGNVILLLSLIPIWLMSRRKFRLRNGSMYYSIELFSKFHLTGSSVFRRSRGKGFPMDRLSWSSTWLPSVTWACGLPNPSSSDKSDFERWLSLLSWRILSFLYFFKIFLNSKASFCENIILKGLCALCHYESFLNQVFCRKKVVKILCCENYKNN